VLINEYDPSWPESYERIAAVVAKSLQGVDHKIEHVGSTAVPGLAAKPIVDIDVVYIKAKDFLEIGKRGTKTSSAFKGLLTGKRMG
jgi:GrpB-like predicted nucleotidyltransferase (UPF0157 family)